MISERHIASLVKLLDDEDAFVSRSAYDELIRLGFDIVPLISKFKESADGRLKNLLNEIIDVLKYRRYVDDVISYFKDAEKDIEQGAFLVARFAYPDVNFKEYSEMLNLMSLDLKKRIYTKNDLFEIIDAVNNFFFVEKGFRGNFENYYEPDNVFINRVIERRVGIPITLSLVYILIGRGANLPVYGVGIPGRFVVRYELNGFEIYVDTFNGGKLMSRTDCEKLISQLGYPKKQEYFLRATPESIVKRMFENLVVAYKNSGYVEKANRVIEIIKTIEHFNENLHSNG